MKHLIDFYEYLINEGKDKKSTPNKKGKAKSKSPVVKPKVTKTVNPKKNEAPKVVSGATQNPDDSCMS